MISCLLKQHSMHLHSYQISTQHSLSVPAKHSRKGEPTKKIRTKGVQMTFLACQFVVQLGAWLPALTLDLQGHSSWVGFRG